MLRAIRNNWEKSKAAVLIDQAFSRSPLPFLLSEPPAQFANRLVETFWSTNKQNLDGSRGPKPSPIAFAAGALAQGVDDFRESELVMGVCYGALFRIVEEVQRNRFHYALNGPDLVLLEAAEAVLGAVALDALENVADDDVRDTPELVGVSQRTISESYDADAVPPLDKELSARATDLDARLQALTARQGRTRA